MSITLNIYVQTNTAKNSIEGLDNKNRIKIKVTAPPIEGRANDVLIKFLAKKLHTAKSNLAIISGERSRYKRILCSNISEEKVMSLLNQKSSQNLIAL